MGLEDFELSSPNRLPDPALRIPPSSRASRQTEQELNLVNPSRVIEAGRQSQGSLDPGARQAPDPQRTPQALRRALRSTAGSGASIKRVQGGGDNFFLNFLGRPRPRLQRFRPARGTRVGSANKQRGDNFSRNYFWDG